jgi:hypothetical protein
VSLTWHISRSKYLKTIDFVIFDENCEHLARAGKKRRFDDFLGTEIQSLTKTIELGYRHATQPSKVQDTKRMITRLRRQKRRLEETRDTWVWRHVREDVGQPSSTLGEYDEKAPFRDGESKWELQSMLSLPG